VKKNSTLEIFRQSVKLLIPPSPSFLDFSQAHQLKTVEIVCAKKWQNFKAN